MVMEKIQFFFWIHKTRDIPEAEGAGGMREWEMDVRKQKAVTGSDDSPKHFWEPQLELHSARGSTLQA